MLCHQAGSECWVRWVRSVDRLQLGFLQDTAMDAVLHWGNDFFVCVVGCCARNHIFHTETICVQISHNSSMFLKMDSLE